MAKRAIHVLASRDPISASAFKESFESFLDYEGIRFGKIKISLASKYLLKPLSRERPTWPKVTIFDKPQIKSSWYRGLNSSGLTAHTLHGSRVAYLQSQSPKGIEGYGDSDLLIFAKHFRDRELQRPEIQPYQFLFFVYEMNGKLTESCDPHKFYRKNTSDESGLSWWFNPKEKSSILRSIAS